MSKPEIPHPVVFVDKKRLELIKGYRVHEQRTPGRPLRVATPSQTLGPFFSPALIREGDDDLACRSPGGARAEGTPIVVGGGVLDEAGKPVRKALIEVWQANRWGKYEHPDDITEAPLDPNLKPFGRMLTGDDGRYRFRSIKPGAYPNPGYDNWMRPPHIHYSIFAAGVMQRLITQMYFPGEALNDIDPILNGIEDLEARASLIARELPGAADGARAFEFDIVLRGKAETAFSSITEPRAVDKAIPDCLGPLASPSPPGWALPAGAWDTHFHVLGPRARFPYASSRKYTPPDAPLEACLRLHDALGVARGIVVHANTHGFDNAVDLDAAARSNGRYLGVVRLDGSATRAGCERLHRAGVRGVRFAFNPQHGGELDRGAFEQVLRCIEGLGWFVELHFEGAALPALRAWLESIPATVVIDHFGRIDCSLGPEQEPFGVLCELLRRENFWVKISGADRITRQGYPYDDVAPFARRLVEIAPQRILWGSDWPHTGVFDPARMPDDGRLLDALARFVADERARRRILVDNPERLLKPRQAPGARTWND